jgi:hypothetical protein
LKGNCSLTILCRCLSAAAGGGCGGYFQDVWDAGWHDSSLQAGRRRRRRRGGDAPAFFEPRREKRVRSQDSGLRRSHQSAIKQTTHSNHTQTEGLFGEIMEMIHPEFT